MKNPEASRDDQPDRDHDPCDDSSKLRCFGLWLGDKRKKHLEFLQLFTTHKKPVLSCEWIPLSHNCRPRQKLDTNIQRHSSVGPCSLFQDLSAAVETSTVSRTHRSLGKAAEISCRPRACLVNVSKEPTWWIFIATFLSQVDPVR